MASDQPPATHPSTAWSNRAFAAARGDAAARPDDFRRLAAHPDFLRASAYAPEWVWGNHMGPNVLWLTEALMQVLPLQPGMRVLDMGCGTALSSIFLARELGVEVWAADLWIPASDNTARVHEAGLLERVYPIHAEARAYPFQQSFFDAAVSIDSYHYWGGEPGYVDYVAGFVKPGGAIGIVVPGDAEDGGPVTSHGEVITTFHSASWWSELWGQSQLLEVTHADMLPGGWDLWWRFVEADMAWTGSEEPEGDGPMLLEHRSLGFSRVVARRR